MFEKATQRMKAILLRSTQRRQKCLCVAFCNLKFIIKQFERRSREMFFNTRGEISFLYAAT